MEMLILLLMLILTLCFAGKQLEPIIQGESSLMRFGKDRFLAFNLQLFAVTLPANPSVSNATVGKDYLVYINTGTVDIPVWTLVGGQRGASLGRKADSIDVSNKTNNGWKASKPGLRSWSLDLDGLVLLQDIGLQALEQAFMDGVEVNVKLEYPDGSYQTGWGGLTDFSLDAPHDGEASVKGTIDGNGPLSDRVPSISPLAVTVSKASATDQTFTIAPSTTTVSSVKNGATALTVTTQYTYSSGTLTIKGTYLGGLTVGTIPLTVTTGDGVVLTITVNLTA